MKHLLPSLIVVPLLALAACATTGRNADAPPVDVKGADIARKVMENGDIIEEYRVAGQLRMVKVTPARGAPFYLYDRNGDGRIDEKDSQGGPLTYYKLFRW